MGDARTRLVFCLCAALFGLGACAHRAPTPSDAFTLGELSADAPPLAALDAYPQLGEGVPEFEISFEILAGDRAGEILVERWTRDGPGSASVVVFIGDDPDPVEEKTLAFDEAGDVRVERLVKHDRGLVVEMTPGPLVFGSSMPPGRSERTELAMRLPRITDPQSVRASGTGVVDLEALGEQEIEFVDETITGFLVREVFRTDLSASKSERTIERWFDRERGLALERWSETVRVFGIVVDRSERTVRRLD